MREYRNLIIVNAVLIILFTILFISRKNYEFLLYVGVIIFFFALILLTLNKTHFTKLTLWGLTVWSTMHMAGGGLTVGSGRLYELILLPIVGEPYLILKYDQLVHIIGFGVATLIVYELLKPHLKPNRPWVALSIVIIMAGLGVGALNEIIEFVATVIVPETGVGGYINTSLDLVADLIGAIIALIIIKKREAL